MVARVAYDEHKYRLLSCAVLRHLRLPGLQEISLNYPIEPEILPLDNLEVLNNVYDAFYFKATGGGDGGREWGSSTRALHNAIV